jgi:hypothetical protein
MDCQTPIIWAQLPTGDWTKLNLPVVEPDDPDAFLLAETGSGRNRHRQAVTLAERITQVAQMKGWTESRAAPFVRDGYTAHVRHFCPQGRHRRATEAAEAATTEV